MNITVFGGTGLTGLLVIEKALANGYEVTAFARTPSKIVFHHPGLKVIKGELTDTDKIEAAVKDANVVISVLGPVGKSKGTPVADGIKNIVAAMEKHSVKRLIATATPTFKDINDRFQFRLTYGLNMLKSLLRHAYREIIGIGRNIINSKLDWTLVRLPLLSKKPATGKLNIGYTGDENVKLFSLTREDLANFLVEQINDKSWIGKSPVISN